MSETTRYARAYARRGWAVLPVCAPRPWPPEPGREAACAHHSPGCDAPGKRTLIPWRHRQNGLPPGREEVERWFRRWPDANLALLLQPSRLVVIDCDSDAAIAEAEARGIPPGAAVATSGKGRHFYFALPPEAEHLAGRRTTKRGESHTIDVLGGGIVIAPPSRHTSGRQYEWLIPPGPDPPPPAPNWALEMLATTCGAAPVVAAAVPDDLPVVAVERLCDYLITPDRG